MYINFLENTIKPYIHKLRVSQGSVVKNQPANAGDTGSIPGLEESLDKEMATHSNFLDWKIPWTYKPVGYHPWDCRRVRQD